MVQQGKRTFLILAIYMVLLSSNEIWADQFNCNRENTLVNDVSGTIITRLLGESHYSANLHCSWTIDAGHKNSSVNVQIATKDLEWAPVNAICVGYDYISVYDGPDEEAKEIVTWCGEKNPYSITSSGRYLHIVFHSNARNQKARSGVILDFNSFAKASEAGGCQPDWYDDDTLPGGGEFCYTLKKQEVSWTQAQASCNYDQSNLVSIRTEREAQFLLEWLSSNPDFKPSDRTWISLNDIEVDGTYKWIDRSSPTFYKWRDTDHKSESYYNCVQMDEDGFWQEDFCNENDVQSVVNYKFICEKSKVGVTELQRVPDDRTEKRGENSPTPRYTWILIAAIVCGVILITVIIVVVVVCKKKKRIHKNRSPRKKRGTESQAMTPLREDDRQPSSAPSAPTAPPAEMTSASTTVIVMMPATEPPPSYEESQDHRPAR